MPGRSGGEDYRHGFNGMERDDDISGDGNSYTAQFWEYDTRLGRRWNVDPIQKPWASNYATLGCSPLIATDPLGLNEDWYMDQDGNVQWFASSSGGFSDENGTSWTNIGTEFIEFDGKDLTYSYQTGNQIDGYQVNSLKYDAVSGKPKEVPVPDSWTGAHDHFLQFDYSKTNQQRKDKGPILEGLYSINTDPFVEGTNDAGYQLWQDVSEWQRYKGKVQRGTWRGGIEAWGAVRFKLQFEHVENNLNNRGNFYIHGGARWGSRGCIDMGCSIVDFFYDFRRNDSGGRKIYVKVTYGDVSYEIMDLPTYYGIVDGKVE